MLTTVHPASAKSIKGDRKGGAHHLNLSFWSDLLIRPDAIPIGALDKPISKLLKEETS
jgi:hypothetical protein